MCTCVCVRTCLNRRIVFSVAGKTLTIIRVVAHESAGKSFSLIDGFLSRVMPRVYARVSKSASLIHAVRVVCYATPGIVTLARRASLSSLADRGACTHTVHTARRQSFHEWRQRQIWDTICC